MCLIIYNDETKTFIKKTYIYKKKVIDLKKNYVIVCI